MKDKQNEQIERFLFGELDAEELRDFEKKRATDKVFGREVEAYEKTVQLIRHSGRQQLKARLTELGRRQDEEKQKRRLRQIGGASLILLTLFALAYWFLNKKTVSSSNPVPANSQIQDTTQYTPPVTADSAGQPVFDRPQEKEPLKEPSAKDSLSKTNKLFAVYFQPFKDDSIEPSVRGEATLTPEEQFLQFYWEGNYLAALASFENLGENSRNNENLRFLQANCLLFAGRGEAAASVFEDILRKGRSRFLEQASWYLALSRLQSGRRQEAEKLLQDLAQDTGSLRQADALRLLKALR